MREVREGPAGPPGFKVANFGRPKSEEMVFTLSNEADTAVEHTPNGKTVTIQPRHTVTHRRCRPPELAFRLPGEAAKAEVLHPHNGERLVVRKDAAGRFTPISAEGKSPSIGHYSGRN